MFSLTKICIPPRQLLDVVVGESVTKVDGRLLDMALAIVLCSAIAKDSPLSMEAASVMDVSPSSGKIRGWWKGGLDSNLLGKRMRTSVVRNDKR